MLSYECGKFRLLLPGFFVDTALGTITLVVFLLPGFFVDTALGTVTLVVFLVPGFLVTALDFGFGMFNMVCAPHGLHLCLLPLVRVRCSHGKRACWWFVYYLLHALQKNLVIQLFAWFGSYYCILTVLFLVLFAAEVGCYVTPTAGRWGAANTTPSFFVFFPILLSSVGHMLFVSRRVWCLWWISGPLAVLPHLAACPAEVLGLHPAVRLLLLLLHCLGGGGLLCDPVLEFVLCLVVVHGIGYVGHLVPAAVGRWGAALPTPAVGHMLFASAASRWVWCSRWFSGLLAVSYILLQVLQKYMVHFPRLGYHFSIHTLLAEVGGFVTLFFVPAAAGRWGAASTTPSFRPRLIV